MKKAVIMCRVSSDEQAKGYSLDVQFEQLTNYCNLNDVEISKHFKEDHSAKNFNRPEFQNFLQYAKKNKGKIDLLLVTSWDRFSRNLTDALVMLRRLKSLGIEVQAIEQPIDMSIPENKAMLAIFLAIPEIDNDRRSIKIKGGMRAALKAGRWCRKAPVGYRNSRDDENKPIIIPNEKAEHIQFIYNQILQGKAQSDIRRALYKKGINISKSNISLILRNPVYIGKIVVPELEQEKEVIVEGVHDGIIKETLFRQVQDVLNNKNKKRNHPSKHMLNDAFPLRGILSCSKCGEKMTASKSKSGNGDRYAYYHCNHCHKERYPADKANKTIATILDDFTFSKQAKTLYNLMVQQLLSGNKQEAKKKKQKLQKSLDASNIRIEKLQDMFVDGKIEQEAYSDTMLRYSTAKQETMEAIEKLSNTNHQYREWLKKGVNTLSNLKKHYQLSAVPEKQVLLRSIFPEKIDFDGKQCRTERVNDVLRYILQIDKELTYKKRGQLSRNLKLSSLVELVGIEPTSKQGI